jgi:predicted histidine transporter YuiF (NhaC family)
MTEATMLSYFLYSLYIFVCLGFCGILYSIHKANNNLNATSIIVDSATKEISLSKIGQLVALVTSTWIVFYLTVTKNITEGYLGLYIATWAASNSINSWMKVKAGNVEVSKDATTK